MSGGQDEDDQEQDEDLEVTGGDTGVHPDTVMVLPFYTVLTHPIQ